MTVYSKFSSDGHIGIGYHQYELEIEELIYFYMAQVPFMNSQIEKIYLSAENENSAIGNHLENTDVIVYLKNGAKYIASFFSFEGLDQFRKQCQQTGEFLSGKYFWTEQMFLIDKCSEKRIQEVVNYLIEEGDFQQVFKKL